MTQYIDKNALMAEIERVIDEPTPPHDQQCSWEDGYYCGLNKSESIINTLKVKEVDLEKEIESSMNNLYELGCYAQSLLDNPESYDFAKPFPREVDDELANFARYFFELGLKAAQKGE